MIYTVGEMAKMLNVPASTLRYYDKEGLFPNMERQSGIRQFSDEELERASSVDVIDTETGEVKDGFGYFIIPENDLYNI